MASLARHLSSQAPMARAFGGVVMSEVRRRLGQVSERPPLPGPIVAAVLPPRPRALIDDYLLHVGGSPEHHRGTVPPHLFAQWAFPLQLQGLAHLDLPLVRALNGGCRLTMHHPLPDHEDLQVSAQLIGVDENERRTVLTQEVVTETHSAPRALVAHVDLVIRGKGRSADAKRDGAKKEGLIPSDAESLETLSLAANVGQSFAMLTGDFNPVHWLAPYARRLGFDNVIMHGFSTMARAMEVLVQRRLDSDVLALHQFSCRFTKAIVLPAKVAVWATTDRRLFVGEAVQSPAAMVASYQTKG